MKTWIDNVIFSFHKNCWFCANIWSQYTVRINWRIWGREFRMLVNTLIFSSTFPVCITKHNNWYIHRIFPLHLTCFIWLLNSCYFHLTSFNIFCRLPVFAKELNFKFIWYYICIILSLLCCLFNLSANVIKGVVMLFN